MSLVHGRPGRVYVIGQVDDFGRIGVLHVSAEQTTTKTFAPCKIIAQLEARRCGSRTVLPNPEIPATLRNAALVPGKLESHERRSFRGGWLEGTQRHHSDSWRHDDLWRRRVVQRDRRRIIDPKHGCVIVTTTRK